MPAVSRTVRVFISSTFRDMHVERDFLIRHVFPEIRSRCKARNLEFVEVDLRWGITEKQAQQGETLERCLEIINTCRPYFVGILGERYGWVPEKGKVPTSLYERQSWLKKHRDKSVTELEILHGVLNNPDMAGRAFFYFRDPAYLNKIPLKSRDVFKESDKKLCRKLDSLKDKIRRHKFPVHENYRDPKAIGQLVLDDLWNAIDRQFPATDTPEGFDLLAAEHQAFAASRARIYTPRPNWQRLLNNHVNMSAPPLVVSGESGLGKSALLANWALEYQKSHPDTIVISHFIGVSRESARPVAILRRIMGELQRFFTHDVVIPDRDEQLPYAFNQFISQIAGDNPVVIVIDALNQLDESGAVNPLAWLPHGMPDNVHLIASTTAGPVLNEIARRGWKVLELDPASQDEVRQMTTAYIGHYLKGIDDVIVDRIVAAPQASNPLYLRVLLDELRITAIHESLGERIGWYLDAETPAELLDRLLERWERDYGRGKKNIVHATLAFLAVSRRGLSEREILELLGNRQKNLPLPQAFWAPFYLVASEFLVNRNGFYWFFHDHLRLAVERRYLSKPKDWFEALSSLADFYSEKISRDRQAGGTYRLLSLEMAEDAMLYAAKSGNRRLRAMAHLNCSGTLLSAGMGIDQDNSGYFTRMIELLRKGCELAEDEKAWDVLADGLVRRAGDETLHNPEFGQYDLIDRAISLRKRIGDWEGLRDALRDKARIGMRLNQLDITESSLQEADIVQARLEKSDPQWPSIHRHQYWGECRALQGRWEDAVDCFTVALNGARRFRHYDGMNAATGWLGLARLYLGDVANGMRLVRRAMRTELDMLQSLEVVGRWLYELAKYFDSQGDTGRALSALWLSEVIYEELQHTALLRTRKFLNQIEMRDADAYRQMRDTFNPFTAEFAPYCSLWGLPPLKKSEHNPVLVHQGNSWESRAVFNPTVWSDGRQLHMFYRAEGAPLFAESEFSSVIGHAVSKDGINFNRASQPVISPTEPCDIPGGCEDPRIVYADEHKAFYLTYTAYDGETARLAMAKCNDESLARWEKLGPVFNEQQWHKAFPRDRYPEMTPGWSKSGAILPLRINGTFWMYFGDTHIWAACSHDLLTWEIVPKPVLSPRQGHFDETLVEPGPPPVIMQEGILLVYNGARLDPMGNLIYSIGQVLLDRTNPTRVLRRSYHPILIPETVDECEGQTSNVVFAEGLTKFMGKWWLYYGMSDKSIGLATAKTP